MSRERLAEICGALPEAAREVSGRHDVYRVRKRTFAHVLLVADGWPPAYAEAAATHGPANLLTFRSTPAERAALGAVGRPYFVPEWGRDDVGVELDDGTDWEEVAELLTESYCILAPAALAAKVGRPGT